MKTFVKKIMAVGVGVWLLAGVVAHADYVYDNSAGLSGYTLNFTNGLILGNEIVMGNGFSSAYITNFSFEIYSSLLSPFAGANVQMQVFLYANNGTPFNGFATPSGVLYDSGLFTLLTPWQYSGIDRVTLNFNLIGGSPIVSSNFTFAAVVTGLAPTDSVGFEIYTNTAVGTNYNDFWQNAGSGWTLLTNPAPTSIGAQFQGVATPEPSTIGLSVIGASLLLGSSWLRRRKQQSKQG